MQQNLLKSMVQNAFIFPYTSEKKISFSLEEPNTKMKKQ